MRQSQSVALAFMLFALLLPGTPSSAQPSPAPSLAYAHRASLGQQGLPWLRTDALLNQPHGLAGDGSQIWVVNAAGRHLLRFGTSAPQEVGRAGRPDAIEGLWLRFPVDVAVEERPALGAGARRLWIADADAHAVIGLPVDRNGRAGVPLRIGQPDEPGSDDRHLRSPVGVAVDGDGRVYVSDSGNHRVQVFDAQGGLLARIGQTGQPGRASGQLHAPARIALSPDETRLYVADRGNRRVVAYDVRDPEAPVEAQVYDGRDPSGTSAVSLRDPQGVAVDATFLYVADGEGRRVQVYEWRDGDHAITLDGSEEARCGARAGGGSRAGGGASWGVVSDVALDVDGKLHLALPMQMRVLSCDEHDRSGVRAVGSFDRPYLAWDELHNAPGAVAVDAEGAVAVLETEGQRVVRYRADGSLRWLAGRAGMPGREAAADSQPRFDGPSDALFLPDGRLLVSDTGNGRLVLLDEEGRREEIWGEAELEAPGGLFLLRDGSLAVADSVAGRLRRYDDAGHYLGDLRGAAGPVELDAPADLVVDEEGRWYVSEPERHRIVVLDAGGRASAEIGRADEPGDAFDRLRAPAGLALDGEGRLLVADRGNHRVQVLDRDGGHLSTIGGRAGGGSGGFLEPRGVAVGSDGRVFVADTFGHRVQVFAAAEGAWRAETRSGMGNRDALAVEALAELDGRLYAGLSAGDLRPDAVAATGAEIWRREGHGAWEPVLRDGFGDPENRDLLSLIPFEGRIYAGVENRAQELDADGRLVERSAGGEIWRSRDGLRWERAAEAGLGEAAQSGLLPLAVFGNRLYAGTRALAPSAVPQLWRSDSGAAGSWERLRIDQAGPAHWARTGAISAMAVYSGSLYVGACARGAAQVWRSEDGLRWQAAGSEAGDDPRDASPVLGDGAPCLTDLAAYGGRLYAALGRDPVPAARLGGPSAPALERAGTRPVTPTPAELWRCLRCDGSDWEPLAGPGSGDAEHRGALRMAAFDEPPFRFLYAAVGSPERGLELWRSEDGAAWEPTEIGGFGDDNNADPGGSTAMRVYRNRLYLGTRNRAQGGELWSSAGTRPDLLPTVAAPTASPTARPSPQPSTGRARYRKVDSWPIAETRPDDELRSPADMALASDGTVYLLDRAASRILSLDARGEWGPAFGDVGEGPQRISRAARLALDEGAGRLYVADHGTRRVLVFDRRGRYQRNLLYGVQASALLVRPDGALWLADEVSGSLLRVAQDGRILERFGRYGGDGDEAFERYAGLVETVDGALWVADQGGRRLRRYRRDAGGSWQRDRALATSGALASCSGARLQLLPDGGLLAGACVLDEDGGLRDTLPAQHRGSDLYDIRLRTVEAGSGRYAALATHDLDSADPYDEERPAVLRYRDDGFDIVTGYALGRFTASVASGPSGLDAPFRLDVLPGGDVVVMDAHAAGGFKDANALRTDPDGPGFFRRFLPDGTLREQLAVQSEPSPSRRSMVAANLSLATGDPGETIGITRLEEGGAREFAIPEVLARSRSVERRLCAGGDCDRWLFAEPIWESTLINRRQGRAAQDYNYAATLLHDLRTYFLLQLWADKPDGLAMPARLFAVPLDGWGRKAEIPLEGSEREALWTDVDAGPDGLVHVLDSLNDRVLTMDPWGRALHSRDTPKDAWKLAGGPTAEVFLLTTDGFVVRLAADGRVLSRWNALPDDHAPATDLTDLGVDAWGRVFVVDTTFDQVSVFEADGREADALEGDRCHVTGDKWVEPREVLLGDRARLELSLLGTCGFVEEPADVALVVNARLDPSVAHPWAREAYNLRVARQIFAALDLDVHRLGLASYVMGGRVEQPLTQDRVALIRAFLDVAGARVPAAGGDPRACPYANTEVALRLGREMLEGSPPGRDRVLVLIQPDPDPSDLQRCPHDIPSIDRLARELEAQGIRILAVNGSTVACSSTVTCGLDVADRGQGTGRPALSRAISRRWPAQLYEGGVLVDRLPDNMDYVPGSARPPAVWNPADRSLRWDLAPLALGREARFELEIQPREAGHWPTNREAVAELRDGWGREQRIELPVPRIRVYDELPPTATFTPSPTATPGPSPTASPSPEPTATSRPGRVYLPVLLRTEACRPGTRSVDVALLLDASGSMSATTSVGGPTKLVAAREAARAFLTQLTRGRDQASLIQFNGAAEVLAPLTGDIDVVEAALAGLRQDGGTRIDLALDRAREQLSGPARRAQSDPVLVLLTDGEPSGTTEAAVLAAAGQLEEAGVLRFTIGLGRDVDSELLRDLASHPEWYYSAPDTSDLASIYERIAYEIPCEQDWP